MIKKVATVVADTAILTVGCLGASKLGELTWIAIHTHMDNEKLADYLSYGASFTGGLGIGVLCRVAIDSINNALDE